MSSRPSCSARWRLCRRAGAPSNNQQDGASNSMPLASCHGCHAGRQGEGIAACLCRRAGMPQLGEPCLFKFGVMLLTIQSAAGADEVQRDGCSSTVSSTGLAGRAACHTNLVHHVECVVLARMRTRHCSPRWKSFRRRPFLFTARLLFARCHPGILRDQVEVKQQKLTALSHTLEAAASVPFICTNTQTGK